MTPHIPVVSHIQITPLIKAYRQGAPEAEMSLDLGLSKTSVRLNEAGIVSEAGTLSWQDAGEVADSDNACYTLESAGERLTPKKIFFVSEETRRHVSLYPTKGAPALLVAGFPMHRIKQIDPMEDTRLKIKAAQPTGMVLDTSMGLGYTAIEAAKRAQKVITIELDPAVMEVAVVARPDEKWGETPCAFVTVKPGMEHVTEEEIIEFCRSQLARFKVPKTVVFGPLPKTSTGKMQKFILRDQMVLRIFPQEQTQAQAG